MKGAFLQLYKVINFTAPVKNFLRIKLRTIEIDPKDADILTTFLPLILTAKLNITALKTLKQYLLKGHSFHVS